MSENHENSKYVQTNPIYEPELAMNETSQRSLRMNEKKGTKTKNTTKQLERQHGEKVNIVPKWCKKKWSHFIH